MKISDIKIITIVLCLALSSSCAMLKKIANPERSPKLEFTLRNSSFHEIPRSTFIECKQDLDYGLKTTTTHKSHLRKNYWKAVDSILISNSLRYRLNDKMDFPYKEFIVCFIYTEAKANLVISPDSLSISLRDPTLFAKAMQTYDWDTRPKSHSSYHSRMEIKIPNVGKRSTTLSTNELVFDWENINVDNIAYDLESEELRLSGKFELSVKELSCGYTTYFSLRDGHFESVINQRTL